MNILEAHRLTKKYNGFTAVDGIDFAIRKGGIFGLLGPNGAGKTTTINMLTGLANITSGSAILAGFDCARDIKKAQQLIGIVPDESNLYEEMDGFDNLCFCGALFGLPKRLRQKRAGELLARFDLVDAGKRPFKAYSKGMKRKLTIAAGIIHAPEILFLDEPTTGIDVASARQIRRLIQTPNHNGTTVLLTTHYIEEAERLCDRIAFLVCGKIVRTGTLSELMKEVQHENIVQFRLARPLPELENELSGAFPSFQTEFIADGVIRVHSRQAVDIMPLMRFFDQKQLVVYEAKIIQPSLEEVFIRVTGLEISKMKQEKEKAKP